MSENHSQIPTIHLIKCHGCKTELSVQILTGDAAPYNGAKVLCDDCTEEYEKNRDRHARVQIYKSLFAKGYITKECTVSSFNKSSKDVEKRNTAEWIFLRNWIPQTGNIYLYGEKGVGKTYMLRCILNKFFGRGYGIEELSGVKFTMTAEQKYGDPLKDFDRWCKVSILLFDDVGIGNWNDFTVRKLWELLDKRRSARKITFMTNNKSPKKLKIELINSSQNSAVIVDTALDRMKPYTPFEVEGDSLR